MDRQKPVIEAGWPTKGELVPNLYLVVDDDPRTRKMIRTLLAAPDVEFAEARDGSEAVRYYQKQRPDLVIMDMEMQPIDGLEATRRIRKIDTNSRIIIVSQYSSRQLRAAARAAGARGYLPKEDLSEIQQFVSEIAGKSSD